MALTRIFERKPFVSNDQTYVSEVIFSEQEINFAVFSREDYNKSYKIWSIELGIIDVPLKANQSVYHAVLKTLKKLQKNDVPSHLIVNKSVKESNQVITTYTIYRLTEEQELAMYLKILCPQSIKERKGY